ncbi:hypothetical protein EYF80_042448 [Liparis tanakae]|uniref:Uncharacterized protein n=1 Tax=Liparis tanakae TaxID=230148 RepID=A0A4Z2G2J0_9TELE|nr:hypothetical protein EYF80_042448 [Liparis tanakae]
MVLSLVMTLPVLFTLSIHTVFLYMMCVLFDCQENREAMLVVDPDVLALKAQLEELTLGDGDLHLSVLTVHLRLDDVIVTCQTRRQTDITYGTLCFLAAVLLGDPLGGEAAHGAAGLCVGGQRAADLRLLVVVAAVQVAGLVEGQRVQQAVARLEETLQLGELLTGVFALQRQHRRVVAGLGQSHELGFITAGGGRTSGGRYLKQRSLRTASLIGVGLQHTLQLWASSRALLAGFPLEVM